MRGPSRTSRTRPPASSMPAQPAPEGARRERRAHLGDGVPVVALGRPAHRRVLVGGRDRREADARRRREGGERGLEVRAPVADVAAERDEGALGGRGRHDDAAPSSGDGTSSSSSSSASSTAQRGRPKSQPVSEEERPRHRVEHEHARQGGLGRLDRQEDGQEQEDRDERRPGAGQVAVHHVREGEPADHQHAEDGRADEEAPRDRVEQPYSWRSSTTEAITPAAPGLGSPRKTRVTWFGTVTRADSTL